MRKVSLEVLYRAGDLASFVLPDYLSQLEIVGIVEQLLLSLHLPQARVVIEHAVTPPYETT